MTTVSALRSLQMPVADGTQVDLLDAGMWRQLIPGLHVCDGAYLDGLPTLDCAPEALADVEQRMLREGYFQAPPQAWGLPTGTMAACVDRLRQLGLSTVFAFVYDEFWANFAKVDPVVRHLLGGDYLMLPDFWVWHVDPRREDAGWRPHRDKGQRSLYPDRRPRSLTIWLPLTDADTLNSCMYVVPADRDATYGTVDDVTWKFELPDVRALPAKAGSLLGWTQALLHWGSRGSPRASQPRVSMAFEFQRADLPAFNTPLIPPRTMLSLPQRIQLICKQILQYQHMYPLSAQVAPVADAGSRMAPFPDLLRPAG